MLTSYHGDLHHVDFFHLDSGQYYVSQTFFVATNFMNWKNFENTTFLCVFFFGCGWVQTLLVPWFSRSIQITRKKLFFFFFGIPCEKYPECKCPPPFFSAAGHGSFPEEQVALGGAAEFVPLMCDQFGTGFFFVSKKCWTYLGCSRKSVHG